MPALSPSSLLARLTAALPSGAHRHSAAGALHPAEFTIPGFGNVRIYLYTVTRDRSTTGRPPGEHKIQLIVDGQGRDSRASLIVDDTQTALLGYSPDFGVFVGWEPRLYFDFAFSANVQVREPLLAEARNNGWAVAEPRALKKSTEVRVAFSAGNLLAFLRASRDADKQGLRDKWREAHMLTKVPSYKASPLPTKKAMIDNYVNQERQRLTSTRLSRSSKFGPLIKNQFDYCCAVCGVQLEIVEAAHIIPVNDAYGSDAIWNGLSMCPNHHTLFDAKRFVIHSSLEIEVDQEATTFLVESGRASGIELLSNYNRIRIREPNFWTTSPDSRERMQAALTYTSSLAGIA
jgi:putative restriction endonuclease